MDRNDPNQPARSKDRKREEEDLGKVDLTMTPMIDVTFQLLIFFMVTSDFKTLEGKIAAYLPKDRGLVNTQNDPPDNLPIRVVLRWNPTIDRCKVYVGQVLCNYDEVGIDRARRLVRKVLSAGADTAEIDAGGDVPTRWVVRTLNMLLETDVPSVNFTGAVDPLGDNR